MKTSIEKMAYRYYVYQILELTIKNLLKKH